MWIPFSSIVPETIYRGGRIGVADPGEDRPNPIFGGKNPGLRFDSPPPKKRTQVLSSGKTGFNVIHFTHTPLRTKIFWIP